MYICSFLPKYLNRYYYFSLYRIWCVVFVRALRIDLKLHQKNIESLPKHYIMIANHPSAPEDVAIPGLFPVRSLAKKEVGDWPISGRISTASGNLYVDRKCKESRKNAVNDMIKAVNSGDNIALYPEGGCTGRRLNKRFLNGAFEVSMRTGVPIIPVFIHYESQEDFEWLQQSMTKKIWQMVWTKNHTANYYVFDAINPKDFNDVEEYKQYFYMKYEAWNDKYLD